MHAAGGVPIRPAQSGMLKDPKQPSHSYTAKSPSARDRSMFYVWHRETKTSCRYPESNQWLIDYIWVAEQTLKETQEVVGGTLDQISVCDSFQGLGNIVLIINS